MDITELQMRLAAGEPVQPNQAYRLPILRQVANIPFECNADSVYPVACLG